MASPPAKTFDRAVWRRDLRRSVNRVDIGTIDKAIDPSFFISDEDLRQALIDEGYKGLNEALRINTQTLGRTPSYTQAVNGVPGAAFETVKVTGSIFVEFELYTEMFAWIMQTLRSRAIVKTGRFRDSVIFLADGRVADPENPPMDAGEYVFASTVPYARKLEGSGPHGARYHKGRGMLYEATSILADKKFGQQATIRYGFRSITVGDLAAWAKKTGLISGKRRIDSDPAQRQDWLTRQPAVIVKLR